MDEKIYLILPGCDDTNRGDQALIWQTVALAREAGYDGDYYMLADSAECRQSEAEGIRNVDYILEHPSARFRGRENIRYTPALKLKWAAAAVLDMLSKEALVHPLLRKLWLPLCSEKTKRSVELFRQAQAAFVKGGGFLHAHGGLADTYKIYYFLYHIRLARSFGVPVAVMPNSFGPFNSPLVKGMLRRVLGRCTFVSARESLSAKALDAACGIRAQVFDDLAFQLEDDPAFDAQAHLEQAGIPIREKPCVAITARPYRFPGEPDAQAKYENYKASLAELMVWLCERGYYPVLVEHVSSRQDHENDMTCIREIAALVGEKCGFGIFSDRSLTCRQMKRIYGAFAYTVGTRFHSVIFSLSSLVPSIAITYGGNKGDGIMADLGLERYALPISTVTGQSLRAAFDDLTGSREEIIRRLEEKRGDIDSQKAKIIEAIRK